ncbi:MAG: cellulase family glycosylhydrolase [Fimbriimonadales bacterium]
MLPLVTALAATSQPAVEWVEPPTKSGVPAVGRLVRTAAPDGSSQLHPTVRFVLKDSKGRSWPVVPFAYQEFRRSLQSNGDENLEPVGKPQWRVRFTPLEPGAYSLVREGSAEAAARFKVSKGESGGFLRPNPKNPRWLQHRSGEPFLAIGWNLCWHGSRGTCDYDDWLPRLAQAGVNFIRLWSCPWAFSVECNPGTLGRYDQRGLWTLERVLNQANRLGIHVMLCLDYHGVLNIEKDFWGSNDFWSKSPYNRANGGPCAEPRDFFTSSAAKEAYRNRLRYLVARFAALPNLAVWEFWNEIDNNLRWLDATAVVRWHDEMGSFLRKIDPYGRIVSTSTAWSPWPELWQVPSIGLQQVHSYGQTSPGPAFSRMARSRFEQHRRPFLVGEYGVDFRGPTEEKDPNRRGLRQAVWSTALSGCAGTAMPWWWETLHARNAYSLWSALNTFLQGSGVAGTDWKPLELKFEEATGELGPPANGAPPIRIRLYPADQWSVDAGETVALSGPASASAASRSFCRFLHGTSKADVRHPIRLLAHLAEGAEIAVHVDSVSNGAVLAIKANGQQLLRRELPNKDNAWLVNKEYDETIKVPLPAGRAVLLELENPGEDWVNIEWIEVSGVHPADVGSAGPPVFSTGIGTRSKALVWILDRRMDWPSGATERTASACSGAKVTILGLEDGEYTARWFDTRKGAFFATTSPRSRQGTMQLDVPEFREDVAVRIERRGRIPSSGGRTIR